MCYTTKMEQDAKKLERRFKFYDDLKIPLPSPIFSAFDFPKTPIIANDNPNTIQLYNWGLIPSWSKDMDIRKFTLNAKLETITEKPSFKNYLDNRCLIVVDGFYEWQWLDPKGKQKLKYLITNEASEIYTIGGIWSAWENPINGEVIKSYSMVTQPANELMSEIHNTKKRMPFVLNPNMENDWLDGKPMEECIEPISLKATPIYDKPIQTSLF